MGGPAMMVELGASCWKHDKNDVMDLKAEEWIII